MDIDQMETSLDPIAVFRMWLKDAEAREPNDPNAVALATATADGAPSVRIVLMKGLDERGFAFYTNAESQKGVELAENPRAAMCFHWKSLQRQVRVEGTVTELPAAEAGEDFPSRARGRWLGGGGFRQAPGVGSRKVEGAMGRPRSARYEGEFSRAGCWEG